MLALALQRPTGIPAMTGARAATAAAWRHRISPEVAPDAVAAVMAALASLAANTQRAYHADLADLAGYCAEQGERVWLLPATPRMLAGYLSARVEGSPRLALATMERRLAAVRTIHQTAGIERPDNPGYAPEVLRALWSLRRRVPPRRDQAAPVTIRELRQMAEACPQHLVIGVRDLALLLLGYATLARPADLVALDIEDVVLVDEGLEVTLGRRRRGREPADPIAVPAGQHPQTDAVGAWLAWAEGTGLAGVRGPAFRPVPPYHARMRPASDPAGVALRAGIQAGPRLDSSVVRDIVRRAAAAAGLDNPHRYRGNSLRFGAEEQLRAAHTGEREIAEAADLEPQAVRRHPSHERIWRDPVAARLGM
jgi:integrase